LPNQRTELFCDLRVMNRQILPPTTWRNEARLDLSDPRIRVLSSQRG